MNPCGPVTRGCAEKFLAGTGRYTAVARVCKRQFEGAEAAAKSCLTTPFHRQANALIPPRFSVMLFSINFGLCS